jgi:hypothetical protein
MIDIQKYLKEKPKPSEPHEECSLEQFVWAGGKTKVASTVCSNPICRGVIKPGDEFFTDHLNGARYCSQCGVCLRFHRKKARQRGEEVPMTFGAVDAVMKEKFDGKSHRS